MWLALDARPVGLAGVRRVRLTGDGTRRERPGVVRARRRGPAWAVMGLLRLLVLAVLVSEPSVAGGAETVGNFSEGKVRGASLLQPQVGFAFLARLQSTLGSVHLVGQVVSSEPSGVHQGPFLLKETRIAKEDSPSTFQFRPRKWEGLSNLFRHVFISLREQPSVCRFNLTH